MIMWGDHTLIVSFLNNSQRVIRVSLLSNLNIVFGIQVVIEPSLHPLSCNGITTACGSRSP